MKNKYKLPENDYYTMLSFIRGHRQRVKRYNQERADILNGGGARYLEIHRGSDSERVYLPSAKGGKKPSSTETKALALACLDESETAFKIRAVQQSMNEATQCIRDAKLRSRLQEALLNNIESREWPFYRLDLPGISEDKFFGIKHHFVFLVHKKFFKNTSEQ